MTIRKLSILLIFLLPLCTICSMGHISYICFDPSICNAKTIIEKLDEWRAEGGLFLYLEKKDRNMQQIMSEEDFDEYAAFLLSTGMNGVRPSMQTIEDINSELIAVLRENVQINNKVPTLKGELDNRFIFEVIVPEIIIESDDYEKILELIRINELDARCEVRIWASNINCVIQIQ